MGFKGMGRVFTRKLGGAHSVARRRVSFAKAVDLELPLLRSWQHELCDPLRCGRARCGATEVCHR
jgi:hypothetical protein